MKLNVPMFSVDRWAKKDESIDGKEAEKIFNTFVEESQKLLSGFRFKSKDKYSNHISIVVEGIVESENISKLNADSMTIQIPDGLNLKLDDLKPFQLKNLQTDTSWSNRYELKVISNNLVFNLNQKQIVTKVTGSPEKVASWILPILSQYEAKKEEEKQQKEKKEQERLKDEAAHFQEKKNQLLEEISEVREELTDLECRINEETNHHKLPYSVYSVLYPNEEG